MNSIILKLAAPYVKLLLIVFSVIALLRGHNHPGGGFIGGLLAAMASIYTALAFSFPEYLKGQKQQSIRFLILGLSFVLVSTLPGMFMGSALMKGLWISLSVLGTEIKLGTPFVFDIGVYFVVIGIVTLLFSTLVNAKLWK